MKTKIKIYVSRYYKNHDMNFSEGEMLAIQTNFDKEKGDHYCSIMHFDPKMPDKQAIEEIKKLLISTFKRTSSELKNLTYSHLDVDFVFNQEYSISGELLYSKSTSNPFLGVHHEILLKKPVIEKDIKLFMTALENIPFLGWATREKY